MHIVVGFGFVFVVVVVDDLVLAFLTSRAR
jgi:hypothetical protein